MQSPEKFKMKYSLATNFDPQLIEEIVKIDIEKSIKSVYGKQKSDAVGGGRYSMLLPDLSREALGSYIKLCHDSGLQFNYLLNPMCLANKEFDKSILNE